MNEFQPQHYPPPYPSYPTSPKTNGKAIAALVLGICAIIIPYIGFIIGIIAIIMSKLSFNEIKRSGDGGKGMAIAGLVCGIIGLVFYAIIFLIIILTLVIYSTKIYGY
ncbi:DUF4190 domain-containing protein [Paenibacillus sp. MSJ-34]|uniref:DUF4190 domain-containing protein n=1 Tax=Paenibacillus sp. MSJ-34 TaxID=2841529 RepID=UPI00209D42C4|nr:DUF4190 domain-containing protein [Paenibacillus sp. MSJ-34]